jgi:hypothetical protein
MLSDWANSLESSTRGLSDAALTVLDRRSLRNPTTILDHAAESAVEDQLT